MERFIKLGTERIRLSEIKSYSIADGDLCIETEDDYFTYYKEDVENLDAVIKYLDSSGISFILACIYSVASSKDFK